MFNKQIQIEVKDSSEVGNSDETVEKKINEKEKLLNESSILLTNFQKEVFIISQCFN